MCVILTVLSVSEIMYIYIYTNDCINILVSISMETICRENPAETAEMNVFIYFWFPGEAA